jgi:signal transduction histidine kinase
VARLQQALDDLLRLLRIEEELFAEQRDRVQYAQLIEQVLAEYRREPRCADWTLRADVAPDVEEVWLVSERWMELLRNLIDNALIQPATRREVVVSARRTPSEIITRVIDFGPGIPLADKDKIFRRFFTRRPPGGPRSSGCGYARVRMLQF